MKIYVWGPSVYPQYLISKDKIGSRQKEGERNRELNILEGILRWPGCDIRVESVLEVNFSRPSDELNPWGRTRGVGPPRLSLYTWKLSWLPFGTHCLWQELYYSLRYDTVVLWTVQRSLRTDSVSVLDVPPSTPQLYQVSEKEEVNPQISRPLYLVPVTPS